MNVFLFANSVLLPFAVSLIGVRLRRNPPKRVNWFYGYRTPRSMRSPEAWEYANRRCGEIWSRMGLVVGAVSTVVAGLHWNKLDTVSPWLVGFQLVSLFLTLPIVEHDLKHGLSGGR
ncbi:MAG: SdpI family protein [Bacillota bacterium]